MEKIKLYIRELTIVTIGVLIALVISNFKENIQAQKYYKASIETINNEIIANQSSLKRVIEKQINLNDTMSKYGDSPIPIFEIFHKTGGLQSALLNNSGLDFYKRNQINSIDFDLMSKLNQMEILTKLIDIKLNKLMNFTYSNIFNNSKENKMILSIYIQDALDSEKQLMSEYKEFIDKYIEPEHNKK